MQNNIDYREIVQTVTANVLTDIKAQLASMKSEIVDDLAEKVKSSLQPSFDALSSQIGVQRRVSQPEQNSSSSNKHKINQTSRTNNDISPQLAANSKAMKLLLLIQDRPHIVFNGWIIYFDNDGNIHNLDDNYGVFIVRENGTNDKNISKMFEEDYWIKNFISVFENGSDWLVKYRDSDNKSYVAIIRKP